MPTKVDRSDHPRSRMQTELDRYPIAWWCLIELIWSAVRTQHDSGFLSEFFDMPKQMCNDLVWSGIHPLPDLYTIISTSTRSGWVEIWQRSGRGPVSLVEIVYDSRIGLGDREEICWSVCRREEVVKHRVGSTWGGRVGVVNVHLIQL
jgi:hypothetical protein